MKNPKSIDFTLIFDGADGLWPSISIFEGDISKFLKEKGIEAIVTMDIDGGRADYTVFLQKLPEIKHIPQQRPVSPGKQMDKIRKQIGRK